MRAEAFEIPTLACAENVGCASGFSNKYLCVPASCRNIALDAGETDLDCGGANTCDRCAPGRKCQSASDCSAEGPICAVDATICQKAVCLNAARDTGEGDVDCGGPCPTKCIAGRDAGDNRDQYTASSTSGPTTARTSRTPNRVTVYWESQPGARRGEAALDGWPIASATVRLPRATTRVTLGLAHEDDADLGYDDLTVAIVSATGPVVAPGPKAATLAPDPRGEAPARASAAMGADAFLLPLDVFWVMARRSGRGGAGTCRNTT